MQEQAVHDLERALLDVLVRAVDRVARLEADDGAPAALLELGARLRGRQAVLREVIVRRHFEYAERAAEEHVALRVDGGDAGVRLVFGAVDLARLEPLVVAELLRDLHDGEDAAGFVRERDFGAFADRIALRQSRRRA